VPSNVANTSITLVTPRFSKCSQRPLAKWLNTLHKMQIYATISSGSLAIAASTLDSLLDLMAGGILWFTHLSMKKVNIYQYPIGKLRVQPVGIVIFAAVMATLGMFYEPTDNSFLASLKY